MKIIGDILTSLFPIFRFDYRKQRMSFCFFIFTGCLFLSVSGLGQASLSGLVTDEETGEPILFGDVVVYQNGALITGEQTDFDGNYIISPIDTGVYDLVFKYVGYLDSTIENVQIFDDKKTTINASMKSGVSLDRPIVITCCCPPIIEQDCFEKGQTFTSRDIQRMPIKN